MNEPNIYQVNTEVDQLLGLLRERPPRTVLEIGMANGASLLEWSKVSTDDALLIGVDIANLPAITPRSQQRLRLLMQDSHYKGTEIAVRTILEGQLVDFLFIDGDHSYAGVKSDFEMYSPLVGPKGLIALHDIVPGPADNVGGVPEYWQELEQQYDVTQEFVQDWSQRGYGIGVIYL